MPKGGKICNLTCTRNRKIPALSQRWLSTVTNAEEKLKDKELRKGY